MSISGHASSEQHERDKYYDEPYLVVLLDPSSRASLSIVMAWAGQIASQSLQAIVVLLSDYCTPFIIDSKMKLTNATFFTTRIAT